MPKEQESTPQRKLEHIRIILNNDTQYHNKTTMLENVKVLSNGPSINPEDVDISTTLLAFSAGILLGEARHIYRMYKSIRKR